MSEKLKRIPERHEIAQEDTWDLSGVFTSDNAWHAALGEYERMTEKLPSFKGTLARSAESLADYMDFSRDHDILDQRLGLYAYARWFEDERVAAARGMVDKHGRAKAKSQTAGSWAEPEILAIPQAIIDSFLGHPRLAEYRVYIDRILRTKAHTLTAAEERIAALYEEGVGSLYESYTALVNVDMDVDLGSIDTAGGKIELTKDTEWWKLRESPDREIRRKVHEKSSARWESVKTTLATFVSGEIKRNATRAKVRGHASARAAALFKDNISEEVYDNLIATVGENLDAVHRYYGLRKRAAGVEELRSYDLSLPLTGPVKRKTTWNEAACLISDALLPLGDEYASTLRAGLLGRWADRYPNQGKSAGWGCLYAYGHDPLITVPFDEDWIGSVGGVAHESGHVMHHRYSMAANPFRHFCPSIFEAEVASTFHQEMVSKHMLKLAGDDRDLRLHLLNDQVSNLANMLYNLTRAAEFELALYRLEEAGTPLSADVLRGEYNRLLAKYRGPEFVTDDSTGLGGLFGVSFNPGATPFYDYQYATGISAAIALADRVLGGGESERADYIAFLKSGGSRFPIDALKIAGVDMSQPEPVRAACQVFAGLVGELERLL